MHKKGFNFLDYGLEADNDPKRKFNSLISVTVSTIMCLAAKCPLPKKNVEITKSFLSTVTDDNGETPRNVKYILLLLNEYNGPFDPDQRKKEKKLTKPIFKNFFQESDKLSIEYDSLSKCSQNSTQTFCKEETKAIVEIPQAPKRNDKANSRKEKDARKVCKNFSSRIAISKSVTNKL